MIDPRAAAIEYQTQTRMMDIAESLIDNARLGKIKPHLWDNLFCSLRYLNTALNKDVMDEEQKNKLILIYDCLLQILEINHIPSAPGITTIDVPVISIGIPGPPGPSGVSSYLYFAWADDTSGTGFTTTYNITKEFLAFVQSSAPILSLTPSIFAGKWFKVLAVDGADGADGADGVDGVDGLDGADGADGNTVLYGAVDPTTEGVNGNFYINTTSKTLFGPKAAGVWPAGTSMIGPAGADGNTILYDTGAPGAGDGVDGDFYIDTATIDWYGPKSGGSWPAPISLIGPTGATGPAGATGADGVSTFIYFAWADDAAGTGFTTTFDPGKDWFAILRSSSEILVPVVGDFAGLFVKYKGQGDRWTTFSTDSMTIGTGTKAFTVETDLAYITGHRVLISVQGDPDKTMEGECVSYDVLTGQITVDVDTIEGSGTYNTWDVSLPSAVVGVASKDGFYGTLAVDDNATATALTTTPVKIAVFDAVTAESASMTVDSSTDTITVANGGAYVLDFQADIVVDTDSVGYEFQIFRNGSALANFKTLFTQDGIAGDDYGTVVIHGVYEGAADGDAYDVRVAVSTGTANVTLRNSRFSVYTVGVQPVTEEYVRFENSDVDTGTENADSFSATGVSAAEWKYLIKKGTNFKAGIVVATWDGSTAAYNDVATATIGTIDVTLSVDLSGGNVRLRATATTNDWIVKGVRTIIG